MVLALGNEPIDVGELIEATAGPEDGGIAIFLGKVRQETNGRPVKRLEYEAYPSMALRTFQKIAQEARWRWGVERLSIVHRLGPLRVGEVAVSVVAAAPHRAGALEACRWAIDQIKTISPIWKKEIFEQGGEWIQCTHEGVLEAAGGF